MSGLSKQKLLSFAEFSFAWVGFCFSIISLSSYQWLVGGPCCRFGLFMQCQVADNDACECNSLTENFSWLQASATFGIFATIVSGVAVVLVLVGDNLWKNHMKWFLRWKKSKLASSVLLGLSGFFIFVSGLAFAANKEQKASSLATNYPQSCDHVLEYGYGFVFAWLAFFLVLFGCVMSFFNSRSNQVHEITTHDDEDYELNRRPSLVEQSESLNTKPACSEPEQKSNASQRSDSKRNSAVEKSQQSDSAESSEPEESHHSASNRSSLSNAKA